MKKTVNIIDLFAGPGGLGEGFSAFQSDKTQFKIRMSVEREVSAHKTLTLRAFFRLLKAQGKELSYFDYVEGRISKEVLVERHADLWKEASAETLGEPTALGDDNDRIIPKLQQLKERYKGEPWVVIGGPPCQAYSLVGRARNKGIKGYTAEADHRHFLYQEYLNVLSIIQPDVFVMENVKGILSSKVQGDFIFPRILEDLKNPSFAINKIKDGRKYHIYSFVKLPDCNELFDTKYSDNRDFIIRAEDYGVPQARHRVILLGVAEDSSARPRILRQKTTVPVEDVLKGLPSLRSKLSKERDSDAKWKEVICDQVTILAQSLKGNKKYKAVIEQMKIAAKQLKFSSPIVGESYPELPSQLDESVLTRWLLSQRPNKVLNHHARGHMNSDLARYLFSACWADPSVFGSSDKPFPKAEDYPDLLAPDHANWKSGKFADRFRVQRKGRPATTVTSHISKDGHYFIHPDATQCRSLTVREAARIQTFPDNYFFEGNRTQQYVQVGNAVPPFLAVQLAKVVSELLLIE